MVKKKISLWKITSGAWFLICNIGICIILFNLIGEIKYVDIGLVGLFGALNILVVSILWILISIRVFLNYCGVNK